MSASIETAFDGLLTIRVSGKLTQPDWAELQKQAGNFINQQKRIRILVIAENFEGWQRGGDWGDLAFQAKYDKQIERMAIVGEKKWEDLSLLFTAQGFRPFPIEYFQPAELRRALTWLRSDESKEPRQGPN
jgi:hypothetical protein